MRLAAHSSISITVLVIASVGCGGSSPTPHGGPNAPTTSRKASLFFSDVELAPGRRFPSPLVRGSVNGRPTVLVVDTGAQVPVVDATLAASAGLDVAGRAEAHDPSGNAVEIRKAEHPRLVIDGLGPLADRPTAVVALPPILTQLGIGAIVSPQALATNGSAVVLDFAGGELRLEGADRAVAEPSVELGPLEVCRFLDAGLEAKALVVRATIDGRSTLLEVDSGASTTFVVAESDAGRALGARPDATRAKAVGAAGPIEVVRVQGVSARSGGVVLDGPLTVMPGGKDERCGYEGRIGIDRLKSCRLFVRETAVSGSCRSGR